MVISVIEEPEETKMKCTLCYSLSVKSDYV